MRPSDKEWFRHIDGEHKGFIEHHVMRGVDIDRVDQAGLTGLMRAVKNSRFEFARWLISQGANVNFPPVDERDILTLACDQSAYYPPAIDFITDILAVGCVVSSKSLGAHSLGRVAAMWGRLDFMAAALEAGLDPLERRGGKLSLYETASLRENGLPIIKELLGRGTPVDGRLDPHEFTPLMLALTQRLYPTVQFLLKAGADPTHVYWHPDEPDKKAMASSMSVSDAPTHQMVLEYEAKWRAQQLSESTPQAQRPNTGLRL